MSVKEKVLFSAIKAFSMNGYSVTKVADIVKGAGSNIASVNYYFGSKEKLFGEVLRHSFAVAEQTHPISGNLSPESSADSKLAAFARAILRRSFDSGSAGDFNRIISKTVQCSGAHINTLCEEITNLEVTPLMEIFDDFFDTSVSKQTRSIAILNFLSLAQIISKHPFVVEKIFGTNPDDETITAFIEQQVTLIMAALEALNQPAQN